MAESPKRASARTTLKWGTIEVPVGLFKTTADPAKEIKFEQAGPNGGELELRATAKPKTDDTVAAPEREDPLALDPGSDIPAPVAEEVIETRAAADAAASAASAPPAVPVLLEKGSGRIVERDQIRRGVWVAVGDEEKASGAKFVDCTDALKHIEELTALEVMEIQGAIDIGRVPRERVIGSYYVGTDGEGAPKVLSLLCQAMIDTRRALVVKWTKTRRQATGVLVPSRRQHHPVIVLLQLCWPEDWCELPKRADLGGSVLCSPTEFEKATELVRAMADSSLLLEEQRDDALAMREQLQRLAVTGRIKDFRMPKQAAERTVLEDLEASLDAQLAGV